MIHIIFAFMMALCWPAQGAVLVEENGQPVNTSSVKTANDGLSLRQLRRVGVGVNAAGPLGLYGFNLELNLTSQLSAIGGIGGGPNYSSFALQMKKVVSGKWLLPYWSAGVARWYSEPGSSIQETRPGILGKRFLRPREKRQGQFSEWLLFPAIGAQYMQLTGEWSGASLYAEVMVLIDVDDFLAGATGNIGFTYYF